MQPCSLINAALEMFLIVPVLLNRTEDLLLCMSNILVVPRNLEYNE